jgi:hypothetical protein
LGDFSAGIRALGRLSKPREVDGKTVQGINFFAHAAKGQMPAAALSTKMIVTGTVVGVDLVSHRIPLVNSSGGMVHTLDITDPQRQAALKRVKVGDSLTAIGTEAFAVALEPVAP